MYKYSSRLGFSPIKYNGKRKYINNKIFNNIPHFIKNCQHVDCLQDGFVMYNDKVTLCKREVIPHITYSMIPINSLKRKETIINVTTDNMTSKFELFSNNKINALYLNERMKTDWLNVLDKYWDERNRPYSGGFIYGLSGHFNITIN